MFWLTSCNYINILINFIKAFHISNNIFLFISFFSIYSFFYLFSFFVKNWNFFSSTNIIIKIFSIPNLYFWIITFCILIANYITLFCYCFCCYCIITSNHSNFDSSFLTSFYSITNTIS